MKRKKKKPFIPLGFAPELQEPHLITSCYDVKCSLHFNIKGGSK